MPTDNEVIDAMQRYGGSFVSALATRVRRAVVLTRIT